MKLAGFQPKKQHRLIFQFVKIKNQSNFEIKKTTTKHWHSLKIIPILFLQKKIKHSRSLLKFGFRIRTFDRDSKCDGRETFALRAMQPRTGDSA